MGAATDDNMKSAELTHVESAEPEIRIHAKTILAVLAIDFLSLAQLTSIVGAGLLAQSTTTLFGDSSKASWLSMIITIFGVTFSLLLSQVADYWGRKWPIMFTGLASVIGPIIISRSQNITTLIVGSCILGLGCSSTALIYTIPSEIVARRHRAIAQASVNICNAIGAVVAILMGGTLLRHNILENYRIFWYVVAGINALGTIAFFIGYNPPARESQTSLTTTQKLVRLDWVGLALYAPGLTLFCVALQWSRNPYGWSDAHILAPFIFSIILLVALALHQWRFRKDGIFDHALFGNRNWILATMAIFVEGLTFFSLNSYIAFEVVVLEHADLFQGGLRFLMFFISSMCCAACVGVYTTWTKQVREPLVVGCIGLAVACALLATINLGSKSSLFWGYTALTGVGSGSLLTLLPMVAQLATPPHMIAVTTGIFTSTRALGGAVGLAINNALLNDALSSNLAPKIAAAVLSLGFPESGLETLVPAVLSGNSTIISHTPGITPQIVSAANIAIAESYAIAFRHIWVTAAVFSGVGAIACAFLRDPRDQFTNDIDAPAEEELLRIQHEIEIRRATGGLLGTDVIRC